MTSTQLGWVPRFSCIHPWYWQACIQALTSFVGHDNDNGLWSAPLWVVDPEGHQVLGVHRQPLQRVALQCKKKGAKERFSILYPHLKGTVA
jgi:hypothetical protein